MNDEFEVLQEVKRIGYPPLKNFKGEENDENTGIGVAPHVIPLAGCTYLATTNCCIAIATMLHDGEPLQVSDHQFLIGRDKRNEPVNGFFVPLLRMLNLRKGVYEIWVNYQNNKKESTYSMLAAIWKSLSYFERGNEHEESKDSIWRIENFEKRLNEFETGLDRKEAIIAAVLHGSLVSVQVPYPNHTGEQYIKIPCAGFYHNYDLVFVRSSYHRLQEDRCENFEPDPILRDQQLYARVLEFATSMKMEQNNMRPTGAMASIMKKASHERICSEEYDTIYYKLNGECERAMCSVDSKSENIKGWEVQRGGILLALQKGDFHRDPDLLVLIAKWIMRRVYSIDANQVWIDYQLIAPSVGARSIRNIDELTDKFYKRLTCRRPPRTPKPWMRLLPWGNEKQRKRKMPETVERRKSARLIAMKQRTPS